MEPANIEYIHQRLPVRLINALYELAEKYRNKGVDLFIFGSFACKSDKQTSDLDLGVLWEKKSSDHIFTKLYEDIQRLPTIRKIDLVNMALVKKSFKDNALQNAIFLTKNVEV